MTVVAGLIERGGAFLVGQRLASASHPLKWEFPGGKVEPDEAPADALRRELAEELAIEAEIGEEVTRYEYAYPGRAPILLVFYRVKSFTGEPRNLAFEQIRWVQRERLPELDFLEGDVEFVSGLAVG